MGWEEEKPEVERSRNPFLSRAGFDEYMTYLWRKETSECRNPFLSRAGFDNKLEEDCDFRFEKLSQSLFKQGRFRRLCAVDAGSWVYCRNPFLSRAGFDNNKRLYEDLRNFYVAIPF